MRKFKLLLLFVAVLIFCYLGAEKLRNLFTEGNIIELKTDHFVIVYYGLYKSEAQKIADGLENSYERIRSQLKDPEHDTVRVFVHPTQEDFNKGTGLTNSTANGTSRGPNEFHMVWTNWFNSFFPDDPTETAIHEFTHCVQLNILIQEAKSGWNGESNTAFEKAFEEKFINEYPQWFWEAICDYEAGMVNGISVTYGMRNSPTLKSLNNNNQIYNVGYTIIEYVVGKWGDEKLPALIRSYVDIETVLGISEDDFEKGWVEFVNDRY